MKSIVKIIILIISLLILGIVFAKKKVKTTAKIAVEIITCASNDFFLEKNIDTTKRIAPIFDINQNYQYKTSTHKKDVQTFFNQGLLLTYSFNHPESYRSFLETTRLDSNFAMGYWGQALSLGQNINTPNPTKERKKKSYKAIQKAINLTSKCTEKEKQLINALSYRYPKYSVIDLEEYNINYMNEMEKVAKNFPKDPDVLTLYAASIMNTTPWKYWDINKKPYKNIVKAKETLEKALRINPNHPGALHYYIHIVEYPFPELGLVHAKRLDSLNINSGHMLHMPSHIYMRLGMYEEAISVNKKAISSDEEYISQCLAQGNYPLKSYPHNIHFLWYATSMAGYKELSINTSKKIIEKIKISDLEKSQTAQSLVSTTLLTHLRFGNWNDILTTPNYGKNYELLNIFRQYARGIAFLRKDNLKEAIEESTALKYRNKKSKNEKIARVAFEILMGEISAYRGDYKKAIKHLKEAVNNEDNFDYREPSTWYIPTRQTLGKIFIDAKKFKDAEKIYLQDLKYYPNNGWSLMGLYNSLIGQGRFEEAKKIKAKFDTVWKNSDIIINSSIF